MPLTQFYSTAPPHAPTHATNGSDALTGALDANGRVIVMLNGVPIGTRRAINFIAGSGVTFTIANDGSNEKVDVQIDAASAGSQKRTGAMLLGLTDPSTPSVRTGHIVRVRGKLTAGDSGSLVVGLYENVGGVNTLRSGPYTIPLTSAYVTTSINIPATDAANIVDYTAVRIQIQGVSDVGATLTPFVSFVEMEIPT